MQPQVLRTHMLELRKILGDSAEEPRFIQTLPKRGYCFIASVTAGSFPKRSRKFHLPAMMLLKFARKQYVAAIVCVIPLRTASP